MAAALLFGGFSDPSLWPVCARLGPDHPDTATSLHNLATILAAQGDLAAARPLFERALLVREARLGADHPDTARSRPNLAAVEAALRKQ